MFVVQSTAKANRHPGSARYFREFVFCEKKKSRAGRLSELRRMAGIWSVWLVLAPEAGKVPLGSTFNALVLER